MKPRSLAIFVFVGAACLAPVLGCGSSALKPDAGADASSDASSGETQSADSSAEASLRDASTDAPNDCRTYGCSSTKYCSLCRLADGPLVYSCIPNGSAC